MKINSKKWELLLHLWKVPNGTGENADVILADSVVIKIAFYVGRVRTTTAKHEVLMIAYCVTRNEK